MMIKIIEIIIKDYLLLFVVPALTIIISGIFAKLKGTKSERTKSLKHFSIKPKWDTLIGALIWFVMWAGLAFACYKQEGQWGKASIFSSYFGMIPTIIMVLLPIPGFSERRINDDEIIVYHFWIFKKKYKISEIIRYEIGHLGPSSKVVTKNGGFYFEVNDSCIWNLEQIMEKNNVPLYLTIDHFPTRVFPVIQKGDKYIINKDMMSAGELQKFEDFVRKYNYKNDNVIF